MTAATDYLAQLVKGLGKSPSPGDVVDALVPEVADLVQLFVLQEGELRLVAFRHIQPAFHPLLKELAALHRPPLAHPTDPVAEVVRPGEPRMSTWVRREQLSRVTTDARIHEMFDVLQPRNIIVVPLSRDNQRYGALVVVVSESGRRFLEGDLAFMSGFARAAGELLSPR